MSLTDLVEDASAIEAMVGIAPAEPAVAEPSAQSAEPPCTDPYARWCEAGEPTRLIRTMVLSNDTNEALGKMFIDMHCRMAINPGANAEPSWLAIVERVRLSGVLHAFRQFISRALLERGLSQNLQLYFLRIILSLQQLNDGVRHPMFEPIGPGRGASDDRAEIWRARKIVCLALYCLERDGGGKGRLHSLAHDLAKHEIFKRLMRRHKRKTRDALASAIVSWFTSFKQGKAHWTAQMHWQRFCRDIDHKVECDPKKYAELAPSLVAWAINETAKIIPAEPTKKPIDDAA